MREIAAPPVALVTGGSKRLGKAMVEHLHSRGYRVVIHYGQDKQAASTLANTLNTQRNNSVRIIQGDLANPSEIRSLADSTLSLWGRLDVLINNASIFEADTPDFSADKWQRHNNVNAMAPYALARHFQTALARAEGNIINLVDIYAERPLTNHHSYCASKAGTAMLVKSLAIELSPTIRVNGIAPGAILWPENTDAVDNEYRRQLINKIPLKRLGSVEAITSALAFILECDYLNGQVINIDGGRSITI